MKILLSRTMVNVLDALLKLTIGCLLKIIFILICKFLNTLMIDVIFNGSMYKGLRIVFLRLQRKQCLVSKAVLTEPILLFSMYSC